MKEPEVFDDSLDDISVELEDFNPSVTNDNPHSVPKIDVDMNEDRYSRFRLIPWWDQDLLRASKILVVGAGALGNEILKNLALLGIGKIIVTDMDRIENTNLSRSVLYRASDEGTYKSETAARAAMEINPDIKVLPMTYNIIDEMGLGVFKYVDAVICGLDNREARLWVNQSCWKVGTPWVDGAIEVISGVARVFVPPHGACYECTMNEIDYEMMSKRKSCALLTKTDMEMGKIPTTPTTSSVIAGIECQEAVKLLHKREDLPVLEGKGFFFNGLTHDSFTVKYQRKEDCLSHDTYESILETSWSADKTLVSEVIERAENDLGEGVVIDLIRDFVHEMVCPECGKKTVLNRLLNSLKESDLRCHDCNEVCNFDIVTTIEKDSPLCEYTLSEIKIPKFDIIACRRDFDRVCYELTLDKEDVLKGL